MKRRLIEALRCPGCGGRFSLETFEGAGDEIKEGLIICACSRAYPVTGSIPRVLPDAFLDHPDFVLKYKDKLPEKLSSAAEEREFRKRHGRTKRSFGREWLSYDVKREEEDKATFLAKTGFTFERIKGKRVLDAGCGGGRYALVAANAGAEVYAVDLSAAVEKTAEIAAGLPDFNIVQGDLFNLPFGNNYFDYIYSIGVLHHTHDPQAAFKSLVDFLVPGGRISIWVYKKMHPVQEIINRLQRAISTRLPHSALHRFACLLEPYGGFLSRLYGNPRKWVRRAAALLNLPVVGVSTHPDKEIRICDTFDWYSPRYQWHYRDEDVRRWFEDAALKDIVDLSKDQKLYHGGQGRGVNFSGVK